MPGMYATVTIADGKAAAVTILAEAVLADDGRLAVFVDDPAEHPGPPPADTLDEKALYDVA